MPPRSTSFKIWGERLKRRHRAQPGADPGAVIFDGMQAAYSRNADILLVDTAGRLHTKYNLMEELSKIRKVMQRHVAERAAGSAAGHRRDHRPEWPGAGARSSPKRSRSPTSPSPNSTAPPEGGIAFAISRELGIPISYVGTGEKMTDFAEFEHEAFVDALFFEEDE